VATTNGSTWSTQSVGNTNTLEAVVATSTTSAWITGDQNSQNVNQYLTQNGGTKWIATNPQHVETDVSPTATGSVTSVKATVTYKCSAAPSATTGFWLLASPDAGATWTYYALAAGGTSTTTATVDLSSLVDTTTKVTNLVLRFYVELGNTIKTSNDVIQVQVN
jgi:hypothetical protein